MGANDGQSDEKPLHDVKVDGFWMDKTEVTNEQFARFVAATAMSRWPSVHRIRTSSPEFLRRRSKRGRLPSLRPRTIATLDDHMQWWTYTAGANWKHPEGPKSTSMDGGDIRSCRFAGKTRSPTLSGRRNACPPKRSGNSRRGAGCRISLMSGVRTRFPADDGWPISGRAFFPTKTLRKMALKAPPQSGAFRPMATASTTSPGTCGNGVRLVSPRLLRQSRAESEGPRRARPNDRDESG